MITIRSLGGSGEDSRNCFLISFNEKSILLDCGVRREIAETERVYPLLNKDIVSKIDAVYLSHCHEDHSASLPYLYHLGYKGYVYASKETIDLSPSYISKWQDYVLTNNGTLPFNKEDTDRIQFKEIDNNSPYLIKYGRSGHVLGGLWYLFEIEEKKILYTGDICYDGLLLETDPLPKADVLIIDSAYASRHLSQNKQYQQLLDTVRQTISNNATALLPIPAQGRGIDMYLYLRQYDLPILLEEAVLTAADKLSKQNKWLKSTDLFNYSSSSTVLVNDKNRNNLDLSGKIIITPDGMMTNTKALYYFDRLKDNKLNKVIITGHSAIGTLAHSIQNKDYRDQNSINLDVQSITIKVHLDYDDVLKTINEVKPEKVMLFHSKKKDSDKLKEAMESEGITVINSINNVL